MDGGAPGITGLAEQGRYGGLAACLGGLALLGGLFSGCLFGGGLLLGCPAGGFFLRGLFLGQLALAGFFLLLLQGFFAFLLFGGPALGFLAAGLFLGTAFFFGLAPFFLPLLFGLAFFFLPAGALTLAGLGFLALLLFFGLATLLFFPACLGGLALGLFLRFGDGNGRIGLLGSGGFRFWGGRGFRRRRGSRGRWFVFGLGFGLCLLQDFFGRRQVFHRDPEFGLYHLGLWLLPADADEQQHAQPCVHQQGEQEGQQAVRVAALEGGIGVLSGHARERSGIRRRGRRRTVA